KCANNLKQIGTALHLFHDSYHVFPQAYPGNKCFHPPEEDWVNWAVQILPFIEQDNLAKLGVFGYKDTEVALYRCPSDPRVGTIYNGFLGSSSLISYLAVDGNDFDYWGPGNIKNGNQGVIYHDSKTRITDVTDGTSNTVVVGERPPSPDLILGWWVS